MSKLPSGGECCSSSPQPVLERVGHGEPAATNGDQNQIGRARVALDDLASHATQAARDALGVEQGSHGPAS